MSIREAKAFLPASGSSADLVDTVVGQVLDEAAADSPHQEAVVVDHGPAHNRVRWTYADLKEQADRLARGLMALGICSGDRVAVWAPNIAPWLVAEFAIAKVGAVLVTVNPTYRAHEAAFLLEDAQVTCCLLVPSFRTADLVAELDAIRPRLPQLRHVVTLTGPEPATPGGRSLEQIMTLGDQTMTTTDLAERSARVQAVDVAQIQYTSGTTGKPKGAMLSHRNIVNNARLTMLRWRVTPGDRWCNPMPFFHTTGCVMMGIGIVIARATHCPVVRFDAPTVLDTIERERCTLVETVPTMLYGLLEQQASASRDLSTLRVVGTSGAPVPATVVERVHDEWGAQVLVLYGLTEASPTITCLSPDDPAGRAGSSVGRPLPCTEVRVVEPGTERVLRFEEAGELQVRGYLTMQGYLNQPGATKAVLDDAGWLSTGDIAVLAADGYVAIVGRLKDVIIRGGENLYPAEIEDEIRRHPAVLETCVVGISDSFFGEEACAVVRLRPGTQLTQPELKDFMKDRVTHQKVPRYLVITDDFPQTASGKIQRFRLKEQVQALVRGQQPEGKT